MLEPEDERATHRAVSLPVSKIGWPTRSAVGAVARRTAQMSAHGGD
jgi:hypothetical protein